MLGTVRRAETVTVKRALGARIRQLRKLRRLTQAQLAKRAGVHASYLAGVERGERNPALENLCAIARALDVNLAHMFDFEAPPRTITLIAV